MQESFKEQIDRMFDEYNSSQLEQALIDLVTDAHYDNKSEEVLQILKDKVGKDDLNLYQRIYSTWADWADEFDNEHKD